MTQNDVIAPLVAGDRPFHGRSRRPTLPPIQSVDVGLVSGCRGEVDVHNEFGTGGTRELRSTGRFYDEWYPLGPFVDAPVIADDSVFAQIHTLVGDEHN